MLVEFEKKNILMHGVSQRNLLQGLPDKFKQNNTCNQTLILKDSEICMQFMVS